MQKILKQLTFFIRGGIREKMTIEEIIQQILSKRPEIEREQLLERLKNERNKTGGLIADATLLRMIAAEFGVPIPQHKVYNRKLSLNHLVPSLYDVTVSGRVVAVYPPKNFEGKRSGKFASLLIADEDEILRVLLWNDKVSLIEAGELKVGRVVRFSHGYTREDRSGKAELHIGSKSEIEINPENIAAEDYPFINKFATKINEITKPHKNKKIHVIGTVKEVFPSSAFTRRDLSTGTVLRFTVVDGTGEMPVVVWNEKAEDLEKILAKNVEVQLVNAKVKVASRGGFELHVDAATYVGVSAVTEQLTKIADLTEELSQVSVEGEVSTEPLSKEVKTSKGEIVKLAVFELKDETGAVLVSAWREHAEVVSNFEVGDRIQIKNAYTKKGFSGKTELSTRNSSSIVLL